MIRPPSVEAKFALTLNASPPLTLAYLAGALAQAGHGVQVIDAVGEAIDALHPGYRPQIFVNGLSADQIVDRIESRPDLVGVSCMFSHEWPVIRGIVEAVDRRFPGVPIVCGGEHPTAAPEFSLRDAPALAACALGEGEECI